ncbi:hypothetical protein [Microbacterium soli]|uniref:Uncharacterized protein n=1 Tax=Microbacterium soli TaxID=446075 RepID=A0ABP7NL29_9MICO
MAETTESVQQAERIRAAIEGPVSLGPGFLRGEVTVQAMTDAMIAAVRGYQAGEQAAGRDLAPLGSESAELIPVLKELITCGGGYQAGRCDAACVARTMTYLVSEFGSAEQA